MTDEVPGPADAKPGHNSFDGQPTLLPMLEALPTADDLVALLTVTHQDALDRVAEIEAKGAKYFTITSDEEDAKATEFLVPIRTRFKTSEADRVATKTRFDDLAGAVQGFFKSNILDKLGAAPSNKSEEFDPVTSDQYGVGPRITMAQTLYKRRKVAAEKAAREAEAARLREVERVAAEKREKEEAVRRAEEDRLAEERRAAARKLQEEEDRKAEERRKATQAEADRLAELELAASRKRNAANRAAADAAAEKAREEAATRQAAADAQAEADRLAAEQRRQAQAEEDARLQAERDERERLAREEENRIAEARAAAEESASASTADLSRSRGGKGGVASLKEFVDVRDVDREALDYGALGPYFTDKAVTSALDAYQKANKAAVNTGIKTGKQPIKGAIFFLNTKSGGRS